MPYWVLRACVPFFFYFAGWMVATSGQAGGCGRERKSFRSRSQMWNSGVMRLLLEEQQKSQVRARISAQRHSGRHLGRKWCEQCGKSFPQGVRKMAASGGEGDLAFGYKIVRWRQSHHRLWRVNIWPLTQQNFDLWHSNRGKARSELERVPQCRNEENVTCSAHFSNQTVLKVKSASRQMPELPDNS